MRRILVGARLATLFLTGPLPLVAQTASPLPADVASPEAIVRALYETVSRQPGDHFDWDRLRSLVMPGAILIPAADQTGGELRVLGVEEFIAWVDVHTVVGGRSDRGFREAELAHRIERFGDVAQVFSTYEKGYWAEPEVLGRGINSIQLRYHEGRWWVVSIAWDEESGAGPLPARYLPR